MTNVLVYLIIPDVRPELDDERHDFCREARELGKKRRRQGTEVSALVLFPAARRLDLPEVGVRAMRRIPAAGNIWLGHRFRWSRVRCPQTKKERPKATVVHPDRILEKCAIVCVFTISRGARLVGRLELPQTGVFGAPRRRHSVPPSEGRWSLDTASVQRRVRRWIQDRWR